MKTIKYLLILTAIISIVSCSKQESDATTQSKSQAGSTKPASTLTDDEQAVLKEVCRRESADPTAQNECWSREVSAHNELITIGSIPDTTAKKCTQAPYTSMYSRVLKCLKDDLAETNKKSVSDVVTKIKTVSTHNYTLEEDGEYGYEGALSQNDKDAGKAVQPVIMFRYLGKKDDIFTVQLTEGQTRQTASCKSPCDFIKLKTYFGSQLVKNETVRSSGTSIMDAALLDAQNGALNVYKSKS